MSAEEVEERGEVLLRTRVVVLQGSIYIREVLIGQSSIEVNGSLLREDFQLEKILLGG